MVPWGAKSGSSIAVVTNLTNLVLQIYLSAESCANYYLPHLLQLINLALLESRSPEGGLVIAA